MKYYLAVDIGASSGRHIVGWMEDGTIKTDEVFRFPNGVKEQNGHLIWDTESLLSNVKEGIKRSRRKYSGIRSLSVDTWGVDYVLMKDGTEILPCYAYRDVRTGPVIDELHDIISFSELYKRTGIQFQPFNTIYQLYADKKEGRLCEATDFLMMPEYLMYRLCGRKAHEYTNATTTGLVNARSGSYDQEVAIRLGLPDLFSEKLLRPGTVIGEYEGLKVVLCATHDTASAVEGIPMDGNQPYISSGTWSLLGVKTPCALTDPDSEKANYSNEGGVGYNRYQKNIMGMWVVNCLKEEICPDVGFDEITNAASKSGFMETVDINDADFLSPKSMKAVFDAKLSVRPEKTEDYFRCAYMSLALSYRNALGELEANTGSHYDSVYIVGGGAKNGFLNRLTEEICGKKVIALPIEATALGNLKIQMEADDELY